MRFYIPELGTRVTLAKPWTFTLYSEGRNLDLLQPPEDKEEIKKRLATIRQRAKATIGTERYKIESEKWSFCAYKIVDRYPTRKHTLSAGSVLEVDRIYIRKGAEDFSSVTFRIRGGKTSPRFWVKLEDLSGLEFSDAARERKWPHGRFTLQASGEKRGVFWVAQDRLPGSGIRYSGIGYENWHWPYDHAVIRGIHRRPCANNSWGKVNHYDSLEKMLAGAKRLNYPKDLIEAFVTEYKSKL